MATPPYPYQKTVAEPDPILGPSEYPFANRVGLLSAYIQVKEVIFSLQAHIRFPLALREFTRLPIDLHLLGLHGGGAIHVILRYSDGRN